MLALSEQRAGPRCHQFSESKTEQIRVNDDLDESGRKPFRGRVGSAHGNEAEAGIVRRSLGEGCQDRPWRSPRTWTP